jgi:tRNA nucleotidyltransferase (CCA-adding enzyme)
MLIYPKLLDKIFNQLHKKDINAIIVGGFVRDALLNIPSNDIDIELYGIDSLEEVEKILSKFGSVNSVGKSFGICKLKYFDLELDFSLPRRDSKIAQGHQGFTIEIDPKLNFEEAARRRDFTINAIGYDTQKKELLDPFQGLDDLENHLLKAVDIDKFDEDPLRVLRAVMFASRFEFSLEEKLFQKCREMMQENVLAQLPRERIFDEIKKMLLKSKKPSIGFQLLKDIGGFLFFDEFNKLSAEEYDAILKSLDSYKQEKGFDTKTDLTILLSLLVSKFTSEQVMGFLERITNDKTLIKDVLSLDKTELSLENYDNYTLYKLATKVNISHYLYYRKALHHNKKNHVINLIADKTKKMGIYKDKAEPILLGRDLKELGLLPSKEFGVILNAAYEAQMREEFTNKKEAKKWLENYLSSSKLDKNLP